MKILWLFNHPAPYKIDFFNLLGQKAKITAVFERASERGRPPEFYASVPGSFKAVFLKGWKFGEGNSWCFGFNKILKSASYDIVVINGWSSLTEMRALRFLKHNHRPYIFAINGGIAKDREPRWKRKLKTQSITGASLYLAPDDRSAQYLLRYGADPDKIRFYPYSTVPSEDVLKDPLNDDDKRHLKEKLGIPMKPVYVAIGSFTKRKNGEFLIDAIWPKVGKEKELYLIGGGPDEKLYHSIIKKRGLHNVHLVSFQNKRTVFQWLRVSECSLFLTQEDIYGHVVNESLSQGTPVIGSERSNAALHLIRNGINGFLVQPRDIDGITRALETPITIRMRSEALRTAGQNTLEKMTDEHLKIFEEFCRR